MKNTNNTLNSHQLIDQIQASLEQDRRKLQNQNDIIAETKKKTITLSSYSNTFRYFVKNQNQILLLFCKNSSCWLEIRKIYKYDQVKRINFIFQKMNSNKPIKYQLPNSIWLNQQTDKVINYLIQQLLCK